MRSMVALLARAAVACTILAWPIIAGAEVKVRGGEHKDFTRLVFYPEGGETLRATQSARNITIHAGGLRTRFDTAAAAERIHSDRVVGLRPEGPHQLVVELNCDCMFSVLPWHSNVLVIDIFESESIRQPPEAAMPPSWPKRFRDNWVRRSLSWQTSAARTPHLILTALAGNAIDDVAEPAIPERVPDAIVRIRQSVTRSPVTDYEIQLDTDCGATDLLDPSRWALLDAKAAYPTFADKEILTAPVSDEASTAMAQQYIASGMFTEARFVLKHLSASSDATALQREMIALLEGEHLEYPRLNSRIQCAAPARFWAIAARALAGDLADPVSLFEMLSATQTWPTAVRRGLLYAAYTGQPQSSRERMIRYLHPGAHRRIDPQSCLVEGVCSRSESDSYLESMSLQSVTALLYEFRQPQWEASIRSPAVRRLVDLGAYDDAMDQLRLLWHDPEAHRRSATYFYLVVAHSGTQGDVLRYADDCAHLPIDRQVGARIQARLREMGFDESVMTFDDGCEVTLPVHSRPAIRAHRAPQPEPPAPAVEGHRYARLLETTASLKSEVTAKIEGSASPD